MFRKREYGKIVVLTILSIALIPKNNVQATSTTYDFYNEFGTRIEVTTTIKSVYPKNGANLVEFVALLEGLRPSAVSVYNIVVNFRITSYELESTSLSDLNSVGNTASSSSFFEYNPAWGELDMEIQVTWTEEIPSSTDILGTTAWVVVFTLKPGSYITDNYYIIIIIVAVFTFGTFGAAMIFRKKRMSKSDAKALQESKEREEEVMLTSPEKYTLSETAPKEMKFCPHCVAELKGATETCPNCGAKL